MGRPLEKYAKVRMSTRRLTDEEILEVKCPVCEELVGDWCRSLREPNLLLKTLHPERATKAYQRSQAKDWQKAHKRMLQIRRDVERYNEERRQLAEWVAGGQLYAWFKEYGSILWELGGNDD